MTSQPDAVGVILPASPGLPWYFASSVFLLHIGDGEIICHVTESEMGTVAG